MTPKQAKKLLFGMKAKVFEILALSPTPQAEKVFELTVSFCLWSLVDGAHKPETVMPYLTKSMSVFMEQDLYTHLKRHGEA
jgi:hypothetical protein